MRYLLDTCAAVWFFEGNRGINQTLRQTLTDPGHELFMSDVSLLEIVIKYQLGKFPLSKPPSQILPALARRHAVNSLPLTVDAIFHMEKLPLLHRDPFDRLLVAQTLAYDLVLVTPDKLITQYKVPVLWNH